MSIDIAIDIVLASGAMILAWLSLSVRDVFTAIVGLLRIIKLEGKGVYILVSFKF